MVVPITPLYKQIRVKKNYLEKICGIELEDTKIVENLSKMGLSAKKGDNTTFEVEIPFYRTDILH